MKKLFAMPFMLLAFGAGFAAEGDPAKVEAPEAVAKLEEAIADVKGQVEGLNESFLETKAIADKLAKIKVSGYVQAQWQYADSAGIQSVAGGNFPGASAATGKSQERFQLRRGRMKTTYKTATSKYVVQIDVIPAGVSIKDAYATWMEPWLKTFSGTAGVFDRPFGFEISYSSSSREAPERTRMYQALFPGERDLGVKLEIAPPAELGLLQYFNFKGGLFTGMGPTANENDNNKDMIGRLGFTAPFYDLNLAIDGGFSAYLGKVTNLSDTLYALGSIDTGANAGKPAMRSARGDMNQESDRNILGVDMQVYYDIPVIGGLSLRGEYLWGDQPGTRSSGNFYRGDVAAPIPAVVRRQVEGWYLAWIQNLGAKFQAVARYDVFDPNTEVEGKDIFVAGSGLGAADILHSTLGLGAIFHWDDATKLVAYYDIVTNEEANSANAVWSKDLNDNVFTLRMQTKF